MNSNLIGSYIGKSPGLAPLRTRSTYAPGRRTTGLARSTIAAVHLRLGVANVGYIN
jgi:hypothetical protein